MEPENGQRKLLNFSDHSPVETVELHPNNKKCFDSLPVLAIAIIQNTALGGGMQL